MTSGRRPQIGPILEGWQIQLPDQTQRLKPFRLAHLLRVAFDTHTIHRNILRFMNNNSAANKPAQVTLDSTKSLVIVLAIIAALCIGCFLILPMLTKAKAYSGPGLSGNLRSLQLAKEEWQADGHTNEWPTAEDLFPASARGRSLNQILRSRHGELYFINRTGAPSFAYVPKADGRGGELWIMTSNGIVVRHQ